MKVWFVALNGVPVDVFHSEQAARDACALRRRVVRKNREWARETVGIASPSAYTVEPGTATLSLEEGQRARAQ